MKLSRMVPLVAVPLLLTGAVSASAFPIAGKPIRLVVPFPAGSPALDGTARIVAEKLRPALGVPVIVDNRPGAGTVVGNAAVASAAPDGHTLLYGVGTAFTMLPHQLAKRPYDEFQDFAPITLVATSPLFMAAHASVPASNVRDLVAFAKANPGKLSFGSWQFGGINHVVLEQLKVEQALDMVHVPYKGPEDALKDLIEGRVQVMMGASVTLLGLVKSGKLRALGAASHSRMRSIPEIPTFAEQGFAGYDYVGTLIVMGPSKLHPDIVRRLNSELVRVLRDPETTAFFTKAAPTFEVSPSTPEELGALLRAQHHVMEPLIRRLGIRID